MTRKAGKHFHATYGTLDSCSICLMEVLAGFSSHDNSFNIKQFLYSNVIFFPKKNNNRSH